MRKSVQQNLREVKAELAKTRGRRLVVRWTAPKGFAALILFFVLALFLEFLFVYSFLSFGLSDRDVWTGTFQVPATNWFFTLSISPLFHLLPAAVIVVLVSSWAYLTKYTAFIPARVEAVKRPSLLARREQEARRFRALRRVSKRISRRLQRIGRMVKATFHRIRGVSYLSKRLYFARTAVRSAVGVLLVFFSLSLLLFVVVYPDLVYRAVIGLYMGNPGFLGFVKGTTYLARGFGDALALVFVGGAPDFRNGLAQVGASLTGAVVELDVVGKYVLSQSVAAWVSALVTLFYGVYVSSRRRVRRR
jgi:hypothetical protein